MRYPFQAGGALLADSPVYVERKADYDTLTHLHAMDYLLVIEPRQQGKTSLINHLMRHPTLNNVAFAYVDVTTPDRSTEAAWYQTLCLRILRQLRGFIPRNQWPAFPQNSTGWRGFLWDIAALAADARCRVVIALDEIGAVRFPGATEFFSILRDVYNSRQAETEFKQLTFLLAGAFHPRDLIKDDKISPFNIAQRVRLPDFTLAQVRELVGKGGWSDEQVTLLAERIHHWTDGQPYLTQLLCSYLGPDATPADVDAGVERLRREDENHLPPMLERLNRDGKLRRYVDRILAGERIKFYPRENRRQALLELLGVIKEDAEGFCIVRNRIYEQVLAGVVRPTTSPSMPEPRSHPELRDALIRRTLALFIGADLPRAVTGLPSRADLARELARRHGLVGQDAILPYSLAEVAQRVSQAGNRWAFTAFIRDALDTTGKPPQPFHHRIVDLVKAHQIETLITTAYDDLLELAFQEAGVGINRVVRSSDVAFIRPDRPTLIKLYGDAQQPDTLVITDRDHSDLLRDREREPLLDEVRRAFRRNTVLFIGYNLSDPDFRFLFDQIAESRFARTVYAVWPGLPETDVQMWRDRGIVILDVDPLGILNEFEVSFVPDDRSRPTSVAPASPSYAVGDDMDYERGLNALKRLAESTDWYRDFVVQEARLRENLQAKRRYGDTEIRRAERAEITERLNALGLKHCGISFNDLCLGKQPPFKPSTEAKGAGVPPVPENLYGTGHRWAVLVGVNEYEDEANYGRLRVCVKDVHAIRKRLIAGGFDPARIRLLTDDTPELPTRDNILVALKAVADATDPDDLLLFYYSGHGDEDGGESYLVARNGKRLILSDTAVRVSRVKEIVEEAPARAKVIILDACHSGADIGGKGPKPMSEEFIRRVFEQAEGLAILASCKQGQLSYEWRENERSAFTHFLLEALEGQADRDEKGFVTVQDANRHVANGVKLWASRRNLSQTPTLQYTVAGDIVLVKYQR